jgi:putative restriction endonuclease
MVELLSWQRPLTADKILSKREGLAMPPEDDWLHKLQDLKVDRQKGKENPAPHKPLLLLVILQLVEEGLLPGDVLKLSPQLVFRFCTFWSVVAHRRTRPPDVHLPFYHLKSDGFWKVFNVENKPALGPEQTESIKFEPGFMAAISCREWRDHARRLLISPKYFPPPEERVALRTMLRLSETEEEKQTEEIGSEAAKKGQKKGRDALFRLHVVAAYDYTCALTGYRLLTLSAGTIVDAAHIHQFAKSQNDTVQNGLALCKNAHWLFDNGLWTISDDYTVQVAVGRFEEDSPNQTPLGAFHGRKLIVLPADRSLWPSPIHLAWHRKNKFQGTAAPAHSE